MNRKPAHTDSEYTFKLFRLDPEKAQEPCYDTYRIGFPQGTTVLEALLHIQEKEDDSIAFRFSCRSAVCGSCGMLVNGAPVLACRTQLSSLIGDQVLVEPLPNMEVIKDFIVDTTPFWKSYRMVEPWLHIDGQPVPEKERLQSPREVHKLEPYINCVLCARCFGACPVIGFDEEYIGPAAIAKLFRFMKDSRDRRGTAFLERVNRRAGVWNCRTIFRCIDACPKDIRPTDTIEALRRQMVLYRFKKFFRLVR
jgi:succinate dehydrogenase / fumarate reductase iron-sulfur subunit